VIELLALLIWGKEMSRSEKIVLALGSVLVVVGVGGEWVFGGRAATAATALQQASDERIAALDRDQERDHRIAAQSAAYAARLGVSVKSLQTFVTNQEARNNAAMVELQSRTADLKKARDEALTAANSSNRDLKEIEASLTAERALQTKLERIATRRYLTPAQFSDAKADLSKFKFGGGNVMAQWSTPEIMLLGSQLGNILWSVAGSPKNKESWYFIPGAAETPGLPKGVTVVYSRGNQTGQVFAREFARLLNADGIAAKATDTLEGTPPSAPNPKNSSIFVMVGEIP